MIPLLQYLFRHNLVSTPQKTYTKIKAHRGNQITRSKFSDTARSPISIKGTCKVKSLWRKFYLRSHRNPDVIYTCIKQTHRAWGYC